MGTVHTGQSRSDTFAGYSDLEVEVCTCGVLFAAPQNLLDKRREDGKTFYCPNGHSLHYGSENERLKKRLKLAEDATAHERARRDQAEASARAQKAAATRARNQRDRDRKRVAAGVCPCCTRSFKNLRRHMHSQHPEFVEETA